MDGSGEGDENEVEHKQDILTVIRSALAKQEEKLEKKRQEREGREKSH